MSNSEYTSCSRLLVNTDGMKSESLRISATIALPLETNLSNVCPHKLSLDKKSASPVVFRILLRHKIRIPRDSSKTLKEIVFDLTVSRMTRTCARLTIGKNYFLS